VLIEVDKQMQSQKQNNCIHLAQANDVNISSVTRECEECKKEGSSWVVVTHRLEGMRQDILLIQTIL
jgi:hypothetical protein